MHCTPFGRCLCVVSLRKPLSCHRASLHYGVQSCSHKFGGGGGGGGEQGMGEREASLWWITISLNESDEGDGIAPSKLHEMVPEIWRGTYFIKSRMRTSFLYNKIMLFDLLLLSPGLKSIFLQWSKTKNKTKKKTRCQSVVLLGVWSNWLRFQRQLRF